MKFRVLARHRWVAGATITESVARSDGSIRRFTATIRGYRNWRIYQGPASPDAADYVISKVKALRNRIDEGDETVFYQPNTWASHIITEGVEQ